MTLVALAGCAMLTFACGGPEDVGNTESEQMEILNNLIEVGFPENDIQIFDDLVYVGMDAVVTLEASRAMVREYRLHAANHDHENLEQYRTFNLMSRGISDLCIDASAISNSVLSTGLNWAINNYNRQGLTFRMRRTNGNNGGCQAVIRALQNGSGGGVAGFPPGNGQPFGTATVGTGAPGSGSNRFNVAEHVWGHELGHTIGFRHTDWFNRSISCGSGGSEGSGGVGAVHIPGTPTTNVNSNTSIMVSCFNRQKNGELTGSDITALRFLY